MADLFYVKNTGEKTANFAFDSKPNLIPPGEERHMSREACIAHFGDWEARGDRRKAEYLRVKGLYGSFPGTVRQYRDGSEETEQELWERLRPAVEIRELDGSVVEPVWVDPEGLSLGFDNAPEQDRDALLHALQADVERQQKEIDRLLSHQSSPSVKVPEDRPETAPRRREKALQAEGVRDRDG